MRKKQSLKRDTSNKVDTTFRVREGNRYGYYI